MKHPASRERAEAACRKANIRGADLSTALDAYCAGKRGVEFERVARCVEVHG